MNIDPSELRDAAKKTGISDEKIDALLECLYRKTYAETSPVKFDLAHIFYYLGGMIVVLALGWFLGIAWDRFGSGTVLSVTLVYFLFFLAIGHTLWKNDNLRLPGGIFITLSICLIPLAVYSFEKWTGWRLSDYPGDYKDYMTWIRGGWFTMELMTIVGGVIAFYFYRFPLLMLPIYFSVWFMSMDITPLLFGKTDGDERLWVSLIFGLVVLAISYYQDLKFKKDYAYWGYFFGMLAFWISLSLLDTSSELNRFFYVLINIALVFAAILLQRSVFLIFGVFGIVNYLSSLFYRLFADSALFPLILSLVGLLIIYLGIQYHQNRKSLHQTVLSYLPTGSENWLPRKKET